VVYALLLAKDSVELFNEQYIAMIEERVLPLVFQFAQIEKDKKNENRGQLYFSKNPTDEQK
jgi:hypothetical protein